jgi:hypothetical protein
MQYPIGPHVQYTGSIYYPNIIWRMLLPHSTTTHNIHWLPLGRPMIKNAQYSSPYWVGFPHIILVITSSHHPHIVHMIQLGSPILNMHHYFLWSALYICNINVRNIHLTHMTTLNRYMLTGCDHYPLHKPIMALYPCWFSVTPILSLLCLVATH